MIFIKSNPSRKKSAVDKVSEIHPYLMLLYLGIVASTMIFVFLMVAFQATDMGFQTEDFDLPKPLILGSFMLLFSSFTISPVVTYFEEEKVDRVLKSLKVTLTLALAFMICQTIGWYEMISQWQGFSDNRSATFLYILSGLHGLHYLGGLIFLGYTYIQWRRWSSDDVKKLIAITNPFERLRLKLLNIYWHFLDVMWLVIFLFFLFFIY